MRNRWFRPAMSPLERAALELLEAHDPDFLDWIADRLVNRYGESPNVDFVLALRRKAKAARAAIAKAKGEAS